MSCQEKIESFGWLDYSSNSDLTVWHVFCIFFSFSFFAPMGCLNERFRVGARGQAGGHMWGSSRRVPTVCLTLGHSVYLKCVWTPKRTRPQTVSDAEYDGF